MLELGRLTCHIGKPRDARGYLDRASALCRRVGDLPYGEAAQCALGEVKRLSGEADSARELLEATAREFKRRTFEEPYEELVKEGRDAPVGQPVRAFSREDYGPVVYGKGPLFFQALRDEVGDDTFLAILRAYWEAYRYRIATPEGFLAVAEEMSGQELGSLYDKWILSSSP